MAATQVGSDLGGGNHVSTRVRVIDLNKTISATLLELN